MTCCCCGTDENVQLERSCTAYSPEPYTLWAALIYDDNIPDPNKPIPLCPTCAVEHYQFWRDQWNEYYSAIY